MNNLQKFQETVFLNPHDYELIDVTEAYGLE